MSKTAKVIKLSERRSKISEALPEGYAVTRPAVRSGEMVLDVVMKDVNGNDCKIGSIVEIIPWGSDFHRGYRGLWYVVGFDVKPGKEYMLLAHSRLDKWELMVQNIRLSLRCYAPFKGKGE